MSKYVYSFGGGKAEGTKEMKNILGGKGANLAEMTNVGIPVPPGFTISAEVCNLYNSESGAWPPGLAEEISENLRNLEKEMGKRLGDPSDPLLVSIRSGAAISMPGMMDTVLNLGINDEAVSGLVAKSGNERFAWDAYRRFIQMFSDVVAGLDSKKFEKQLERIKKEKGAALDTDLDSADLKELVARYKTLYKEESGHDFPQDPQVQLKLAINAVFDSWGNERAIVYRNINRIPHDLGTAVNVQAMVFGNMGDTSGTGVAFTRNPTNGEKKFFGEYLLNAQGEDVVAGIRTPRPISDLENTMPEVYKQLVEIYQRLESHYKDMQDLEFTVQEGKLYLLQTRNGKRTAAAAIKVAVDMVGEGLIDKRTALMRVEPQQLDQLLHPRIDPSAAVEVIARGLPASPGAAVGQVVFTAETAVEWAAAGKTVILVRSETSPEDIAGMNVAKGILTSRGGMTSHAAVVARGMGTCCVAGCGEISVDEAGGSFTVDGAVYKQGDTITLNGTTGEVIKGSVPLIEPQLSDDFATLMSWADEVRHLRVRTNADTPHDAEIARKFGAEGIGLCRTEHMFFGEDRITSVREMILASDIDSRKAALAKLLPMQRSDFLGIFKAMKDLPVTIRLLDPPLHEFLPHTEKEAEATAAVMGVSPQELLEKAENLKELNPMLGHRGCRLGVTYPEIYEMQSRAIIEAACELKREGYSLIPEIMIPLVGFVNEFRVMAEIVHKTAKQVMQEQGVELEYLVGTMIEVPRAALTADLIAEEAMFFSFGTNDLTQMTLGFSRDDVAKFVPEYIRQGIIKEDPFQVLDQEGVGQLVKMSVEKGRQTNPKLKIGICGEHGGEPSSVMFCHSVGMDYVSCSPFRIPIARLAAAQGKLKD